MEDELDTELPPGKVAQEYWDWLQEAHPGAPGVILNYPVLHLGGWGTIKNWELPEDFKAGSQDRRFGVVCWTPKYQGWTTRELDCRYHRFHPDLNHTEADSLYRRLKKGAGYLEGVLGDRNPPQVKKGFLPKNLLDGIFAPNVQFGKEGWWYKWNNPQFPPGMGRRSWGRLNPATGLSAWDYVADTKAAKLGDEKTLHLSEAGQITPMHIDDGNSFTLLWQVTGCKFVVAVPQGIGKRDTNQLVDRARR